MEHNHGDCRQCARQFSEKLPNVIEAFSAGCGLAAIHKAGGLTMVMTPADPPQEEMQGSAIRFEGPVDLIGTMSGCSMARAGPHNHTLESW
jgi:hypothetical protein